MPFVMWRGSTVAPVIVPCPLSSALPLLVVEGPEGAAAALILGWQQSAGVSWSETALCMEVAG